MQYIFTAIFTKEADGSLDVCFPDIPGCYAKGVGMLDAAQKAEAILGLCLFDMEQLGIEIPEPRFPDEIAVGKDQMTSVIMANTGVYRLRFAGKDVDHTISIPAWLANIAEASDIDLSLLLQDAVRREMGMPVYESVEILEEPAHETALEEMTYTTKTDVKEANLMETVLEEAISAVAVSDETFVVEEAVSEDIKSNEEMELVKSLETLSQLAQQEKPVASATESAGAVETSTEVSSEELSEESDEKPTEEQHNEFIYRKPKRRRLAYVAMFIIIPVLVIAGAAAALITFTDLLDDAPVVRTFIQQRNSTSTNNTDVVYDDTP